VSSFPELQAFLSDGADHRLHFYVFDLLHLNGWDLRPCALADRKKHLFGLAKWRGMLRYSEHVEGWAAALYQRACARDLEGIICKSAFAPLSRLTRPRLGQAEVRGS
jgi:bifunctional non-homologous end joining protein LigD